jgi:hypothetical protein
MTETPTARSHARARGKLDGADAQALEHALTMTERELDAAYERSAALEAELAEARTAWEEFVAGNDMQSAIDAVGAEKLGYLRGCAESREHSKAREAELAKISAIFDELSTGYLNRALRAEERIAALEDALRGVLPVAVGAAAFTGDVSLRGREAIVAAKRLLDTARTP